MKPAILVLLALLLGCATDPTSVEKVLTLREGMGTNTVLTIMGPPDQVQEFPWQRLTQWTWSSRSMMTKRKGSILISDGVVFQVPNVNARSKAQARANEAEQAADLMAKVLNRSSAEASERRRAAEEAKLKAQIEALEARQAYVDARPDMPQRHRDAILEKSIMTGMTRDDVLTAWGKPESKNVTQGKGWRNEQWVYPGNRYLYFRNGVLDTMSFPE